MPFNGENGPLNVLKQLVERLRLSEGFPVLHRMYSVKQRFATIKLIGYNLVKLYKPMAAVITLCSATYGYQQWDQVRHSLQLSSAKTDQELIAIFDQLDTNHNGSIDGEELKAALTKAGLDKSMLEIELMMRSADVNSDGQICKTEWIQICRKISGMKFEEQDMKGEHIIAEVEKEGNSKGPKIAK